VQPLEVEVKQRVMRHFSQSKSTVERHYQLLTSEAKSALSLKYQQLNQLNGLAKQGASHLVKQMGEKVQNAMQFIIVPNSQKTLQTKMHAVEQHWQNVHNQTQRQLQKERQQIEQFQQVVAQQPLKVLEYQKKQIRQWIGFIYSSGPNNQLNRGFAIVKTLDGQPIKSAKEAQQQDSLVVNFKDGAVKTKVLPPITTSGENEG
jgi:exodeoxyribonuclease VII large subunit